MKTAIIERIYKRLLKESTTSNLAAFVRDRGATKQAIAYDATLVSQILDKLRGKGTPWDGWENRWDPEEILPTLKGMIIIEPPKQPCRGAWEVKMAWGPEFGGTIYALGHAISPSGILIPDRSGVSRTARTGWQKQQVKGRGLPLDSIEAHKSGASHPNHTEETDDDCNTYNIDYLDRAYLPQGGEKETLIAFEASHDQLFKNVPPGITNEIVKAMRTGSASHFVDDFQ